MFCFQEQEKVANLAASKFNSEQQNAEGEGDTYEPNPEVKEEEEEEMEEGTDDKGIVVLSSAAFSRPFQITIRKVRISPEIFVCFVCDPVYQHWVTTTYCVGGTWNLEPLAQIGKV